jgi:NNP family nitrate/nitrite transporter-like MFS transporter
MNSAEAFLPASRVTVMPRESRWIDDWRPEDERFWNSSGSTIARRNLIFSILAEHVGFCIWSLFSVFVLFLGKEYGFSPSDKFLLTSVPTAVGAALRIPYTLAVAKFGGRNWTVVSALLLLLPIAYIAVVLKPGVSLGTLLVAATLAGVGGGNFSSSMANIDAFYPMRLKGWALGLNAGAGNLGVAAVQLVGLAVLATIGRQHPRAILAFYLPLVLISAACAWRYMDNLTGARNEKRALRDVTKQSHMWSISWLYIGTFGSFIGFGFAFGQVLQVQFADIFDTPVKAAYLTFLGPLLGSIMRPTGGKLADRIGAVTVTFWTFLAMAIGALAVVVASVQQSLPLFLFGFVLLFILTGIGNGSIYKMIPQGFRAKADRAIAAGGDQVDEDRAARRLTRALIGLAGCIGAFGGVLVNLALRQSFLANGTGTAAYVGFIAYYLTCLALTWAVYVRPDRSGVVSS